MSDLSLIFASALPIEVKSSISKYILTLFGCAGFIALSIWGVPRNQTRDIVISVLGIGFFGLGALLSVWAIFDRTPRVLLDHQGVTIRGWKGCPVVWAEIERAWKFEQRVATLYSQVEVPYVCMAIKDSERWRESQGRLRRRLASYYQARGWGDVYFTTKGTDFGADELVAAIQSHIGGVRLSEPASLLSSART